MTDEYGATTIKGWLDELVEKIRMGRELSTRAGANPDRSYAYLEFHDEDDRHSILVFRVEASDDGAKVRAHRFTGGPDEVREGVSQLLKGDG